MTTEMNNGNQVVSHSINIFAIMAKKLSEVKRIYKFYIRDSIKSTQHNLETKLPIDQLFKIVIQLIPMKFSLITFFINCIVVLKYLF